jgi:hypothetical protein
MRRAILPLLVLAIAIGWSCSDDDPAKPSKTTENHLAGGGRSTGDDPFAGGPDESGPTNPDFEPPEEGFIPLFYADFDCQSAPGERLITNAEDWQAWWTAAIACLDPAGPRGTDPAGGSPGAGLARLGYLLGDSGGVDPDTTFPYPPDAPVVDFDTHAIVVISLEADTTISRGVWVTSIETSESGSTITYQITRLGEDCFAGGWPGEPMLLSPTIAVLVPGPVSEPVTWAPENIVIDCSWEPDPSEPLCIYYTDADCDLGPAEAVLRDREQFDAWLAAAYACDQARWFGGDSVVVVYPDGRTAPGDSGWAGGDTILVPGDPPLSPWIDIDFTTHAVLILRAGEQTRWGGGIWLDALETGSGGSVIDYTAVVPSGECPEVEGGVLNPTVAIRVPLPLPEPITWNRHTETIDCRWDSTGAEPGTGTGPRPLAWRR